MPPPTCHARVTRHATGSPVAVLTRRERDQAIAQDVGADNTVAFHRVSIVEDEQTYMWVAGVPDGARVIVQGQDFVREGQTVDAVEAVSLTATVNVS